MPKYYKIPLMKDTTDQTVYVELGMRPYIIRVLWNERFGYFSLSISESDNTPIIVNVKMVKNYPLTSRHKDLRMPKGDFYFVQESSNIDRPGYNDLENGFGLYYIE